LALASRPFSVFLFVVEGAFLLGVLREMGGGCGGFVVA
jgi:hypothetical protein